MSEIERLENAVQKARNAEQAMQQKRAEKRRRLLNAEVDRIDAELAAEYGDRLKTLHEARYAAEQIMLAAKEKAALKGDGAPWPVGTRLQKWAKRSRWESEYHPLEEFGVLEAVTRELKFAENRSGYSIPAVGTYIIRLEKKDGTLGLKFVVPGRWGAEWRPVS